jgi:uncharacterized membrane protein YhaH (DUF805 family)
VSFQIFLAWVLLAWIYAPIGLAAPRLRNAGHPPWFAMLAFVPKINWVVLLVLLFLPFKRKTASFNQRGNDR